MKSETKNQPKGQRVSFGGRLSHGHPGPGVIWAHVQRQKLQSPVSSKLGILWPCYTVHLGPSAPKWQEESVARASWPRSGIRVKIVRPRKKGINIKNFARNPPPRPPPAQGAHDPFKFFMFGASFLSKHREKPKHKEFRRGGGLRGPKILYAEILRVFYLQSQNSWKIVDFDALSPRCQEAPPKGRRGTKNTTDSKSPPR